MKIPVQYESFEYIRDIEWRDVFAVWRAYEAYQEMWQVHWKERGFDSWDDWRRHYSAPLHPEKLQWQIYGIHEPIQDFPKVYGVPSKGWVKNIYQGKQTVPLKKVVKLLRGNSHTNKKVEAIRRNFPYQTMLTGVVYDKKIVLVEGMHRAIALTMMKREELSGNVVMALAEYDGELPIVGKGDENK